MVYIIITAILLLPWLIIPIGGIPEPTRLIKSTFFDFFMMAVIVFGLYKGLKFKYSNKYLSLLTLWIFITFGFNWYYYLLVGKGYNAGTIDSMLHFILALIGSVFVMCSLEGEDFVKICKAIWFSSVAVSVFAFFQVIGLDPMVEISHYVQKEHRHVAALLDHPDLLGNYLAISVPFILYLSKPKYLVSLLLVLFVILCTKSRISILAVLVSVPIFLCFKYKHFKNTKYIAIIYSLCVLALIFLNSSFNKISDGFSGRLWAWNEMVHRIDNPIFGNGLGIVKSLMVKMGDNYWSYAHNDYLEIYCSLGAFGLFLFILVLINSFRKFSYKPNNILGMCYLSSFVAFLIICLGSFPMEIAPLALGGLISWWGMERLGYV